MKDLFFGKKASAKSALKRIIQMLLLNEDDEMIS
jgi:hypothetical protein